VQASSSTRADQTQSGRHSPPAPVQTSHLTSAPPATLPVWTQQPTNGPTVQSGGPAAAPPVHLFRDAIVPAVSIASTWAATGALSWYGASLGVLREAASNDPSKAAAIASTVFAGIHTVVTALAACQVVSARSGSTRRYLEQQARRHPPNTPPTKKLVTLAALAVITVANAGWWIPFNESRRHGSRQFDIADARWRPENPHPESYFQSLMKPLADTQNQGAAGVRPYFFHGGSFKAIQATANDALATFEGHPYINPHMPPATSGKANIYVNWVAEDEGNLGGTPGSISEGVSSIVDQNDQTSQARQINIDLSNIWDISPFKSYDSVSPTSKEKSSQNAVATHFLKVVVHTQALRVFENKISMAKYKPKNETAVHADLMLEGLIKLLSLNTLNKADLNAVMCPFEGANAACISDTAEGVVDAAYGKTSGDSHDELGSDGEYISSAVNGVYDNNSRALGSVMNALKPLLEKPGIKTVFKALIGDPDKAGVPAAVMTLNQNLPDLYVSAYVAPSPSPSVSPSPSATPSISPSPGSSPVPSTWADGGGDQPEPSAEPQPVDQPPIYT
jgi:hypothetical protein